MNLLGINAKKDLTIGYFVVKYSVGKNGYACGVTKVTPKGLSFLYDILNEKVLLAR